MNIRNCLNFKVNELPRCASLGLLVLRVILGAAFMLHGYGKIQSPMNWMGPDAPVPGFLQFLAALSEFGGGLAWILGLLTPLASFGAFCTMAVAVHMHAVVKGDPFVSNGGGGSYELASIYLGMAILMLTAGPGIYALDRKLFGRK